MNEAIRAGWSARVHAEYRSAALAQQLGHVWLVTGVPPELVRRLNRVVDDELVHADDAAVVLAAAGGSAAPMAEGQLALPWQGVSSRELALVGGLELLALNESLAVPLFTRMAKRATVPEVVAALKRVQRDEPRHADLGWLFLAWAVQAWPEARPTLRERVPGAVERQWRAYGSLPDDRWPENEPALAWGLLDGAGYAEVLARHHRGPLRRRLEELELG